MRIGKHLHLRRNCGSAAVVGHKSIHCSASGCDGQLHSSCKACDNCEASCETCRGFGQQNADRHFIADCRQASDFGAKLHSGEDAGWHGGAASCGGGSSSVEDGQG